MTTMNTAEKFINWENKTNIILFPTHFTMPVMQSMAATDSYTEELYHRTAEAQDKGNGMDAFPIEIYNRMIEYSLANGKIRNAMYLICSANWGMRFSDVTRVRFCHIFDSSGQLRESFTLPHGEQKTKKMNIYYNNEATARIIGMYLAENPDKTPYDYLFVSDSINKESQSKVTLREIEAEELYVLEIENAEKEIRNLEKAIERTENAYCSGTFTAEQYNALTKKMKEKISEEKTRLEELKEKSVKYRSLNPNAESIYILKPITARAAEGIIKNTLAKMNIFPKNKRDKTAQTNLDCKLNTHSLRKTFGKLFYEKGCELNSTGMLNVDPTMLSLLQQKFMHTSIGTTNRYNKTAESSFRMICTNMNVGLEALNNYEEQLKFD